MIGTLTNAEIDELLGKEHLGHLACADEGKPYIVPMAYLYHDNVLYGQTTSGKKIEILRKNPQVCFQVEHVEPGSWKSVMLWGTYEEMDFSDAAMEHTSTKEILKLLTERLGEIQQTKGISIPFSFNAKAQPLTVNEKTSTIFRVVVTEKTGRFQREGI